MGRDRSEWNAWNVIPNGFGAGYQERFRDGWICFERVNGGGRCRLPLRDVPAGWEALPDDRLDLLRRGGAEGGRSRATQRRAARVPGAGPTRPLKRAPERASRKGEPKGRTERANRKGEPKGRTEKANRKGEPKGRTDPASGAPLAAPLTTRLFGSSFPFVVSVRPFRSIFPFALPSQTFSPDWLSHGGRREAGTSSAIC